MTPTLTITADYCPPTFLNRRLFPRRRARGLARCRLENRPFSPGAPARLLDISQDGIGVVCSGTFPVATMVELELEPTTGNYRLVRLAEVRCVQSEPNGKYRLGCRFTQRLTFAEMQRFV
jgi:PilZ domain